MKYNFNTVWYGLITKLSFKLITGFLVGLATASLIAFIAVGNDADTPQNNTLENRAQNQNNQGGDKTNRNQAQDDNQTPTSPTNLLLADWDRLTSAEKIARNPYNCPADENNKINLNPENGQCLKSSDETEGSEPTTPA